MKTIGMDVHARQTFFHVVDEKGHRVERGSTETTAKNLSEVIGRHLEEGDEVRVALEASTTTWWVQEVLKKAGAHVEVTNPYKLKLIAESRAKTDKADAEILAELLRCGGLPTPVYVPTPQIRELRQRLSLRRQLVRIRTQVICSAKAHLRGQGVKTTKRDFHTEASWKRLMAVHDSSRWHLNPLAGVYGEIVSSCRQAEAEVQELWDEDPSVRRLQTIPGIGPIVAYTVVAALGEVERFSSSKQVEAYAGIIPIERSSGEVTIRGGITHEGRAELRGALIQAAWAVLRTRKNEALFLKKFYYKLMHRRGSQVAIVALARKLLTIAYQVLKQEEDFDGDRTRERKTEKKSAPHQKQLLNLNQEARSEIQT